MASGLEIATGAIGIIGVSQQVVQTAFKARNFCKEVKDAPTELRQLTRSLETLSRILIRLRDTIPTETWISPLTPSNVDILQASLQACHDDSARISVVISDAHRMLEQQRFRGSCTLVLKKREVRSMLEKLDRSKADLSLAYSIYSSSSVLERAITRPWASQMHGDAPLDNDPSSHSHGQRPEFKRSKTGAASSRSTSLRLSLPRMLCETACEIAWLRAAGQWTLSLKTYRVLGVLSPALHMCLKGDVVGIRQMLENRMPSVHDQSEGGRSLYAWAASRGNFDLTTYLLSHGAEATRLPDLMAYDLDDEFFNAYRSWLSPTRSLSQAREHAQLVLEGWQGAPPNELTAIAKMPHSWTPEDWLAVLSTLMFQSSLGELLNLAQTDRIDAHRFPAPRDGQTGVLHVLARYARKDIQDYKMIRLNWVPQVQSYAQSGYALSLVDETGCTPFMLFMAGTLSTPYISPFSRIHYWAHALIMAGIDLQAYGEIEQRALRTHENLRTLLDRYGFIGFSFGGRPDQWRLWQRHPGDLYAGVFWRSIEHPELSMPGAWVHQDVDEPFHTSPTSRYIKRKQLRRLRSRLKDGVRKHRTEAMAMLNALAQLRGFFARFGDCRKRRSAVPKGMLGRMRDLMCDLGLPGRSFDRQPWFRRSLPAPETLQWF